MECCGRLQKEVEGCGRRACHEVITFISGHQMVISAQLSGSITFISGHQMVISAQLSGSRQCALTCHEVIALLRPGLSARFATACSRRRSSACEAHRLIAFTAPLWRTVKARAV